MDYLIIGAGAIGTYIGASLMDAGKEVAFLEREEFVANILNSGLHLLLPNREIHIHKPIVFSNVEAALIKRKNVVVFAMKSFDTIEASQQLSGSVDRFDAVLCLQNGVENEDKIGKILGKGKVIAGSVTSAVSRSAAGQVALEKERGIGIEHKDRTSEKIAADFLSAGLHPKLFSSRENMKWSKMLSNLMGNATCAILDMSPKQVFEDPDLFHLEMEMMKEALRVMKSYGWNAVDLPRTPMGLLCRAIQILPEGMARSILMKPLGGGRGNKMPSFHIDLHSGKRSSEVDYLNGAVSRFGTEHGIATPVNDKLTSILLRLVDHHEEIDIFRQNKALLLSEMNS